MSKKSNNNITNVVMGEIVNNVVFDTNDTVLTNASDICDAIDHIFNNRSSRRSLNSNGYNCNNVYDLINYIKTSDDFNDVVQKNIESVINDIKSKHCFYITKQYLQIECLHSKILDRLQPSKTTLRTASYFIYDIGNNTLFDLGSRYKMPLLLSNVVNALNELQTANNNPCIDENAFENIIKNQKTILDEKLAETKQLILDFANAKNELEKCDIK